MPEVNMKLSEDTLNVLRNFSIINPSLVFKQGNVIRTISKQENILARATVDDSFDNNFTIYDLNRFLSVLSSMDNPDIGVDGGSSLVISDDKSKVRYGLSDEVLVVSPRPKMTSSYRMPKIHFRLNSDNFTKIVKMAGVMGLPNIVVRGDRKNISIAAIDVKNADSDVFSIDVGETSLEFQTIFNYENLKIVNADYDVSISTDGISHFSRVAGNLDYWIATESGSSFVE